MFKALKETLSTELKYGSNVLSHREYQWRGRNYKNGIEYLELKSTIIEIKKKNHLSSTADLTWQKKESENLEIGQLRFYSLTNRKKKKKNK